MLLIMNKVNQSTEMGVIFSGNACIDGTHIVVCETEVGVDSERHVIDTWTSNTSGTGTGNQFNILYRTNAKLD